MKKLVLFLCIAFFISCSDDNEKECVVVNIKENAVQETCYSIFSIGSDKDGDYIVIGINQKDVTDRKRYKVTDYKTYLGRTTICNLNNLYNGLH